MSDISFQALEKAAKVYEERLVPAFFAKWAGKIAAAANLQPGELVLDVACGSGILARECAKLVGESGSATGVDPNPGMLSVARSKAPDLEWKEGEATALPFESGSFDAVVSQFGLMFFPEPGPALTEMRRVLKPEGRMVIAVFDRVEQAPAYAAMAGVLERLVSPEAATMLLHPFCMGDREDLAQQFAGAGLSGAEIHTDETQAHFPSVREMVLADVEGWFPLAGIHLTDAQVEEVVTEAEHALSDWTRSDGAVEFTVSVHVVSWKNEL